MTEPSQPSYPHATGGMSQAGTTTVVKIAKPKVSLGDRAALCPVICKCKDAPGVGSDGRSLKQVCVSKTLAAADKAADHRSPYKSEVNYDMTKDPPAPIMDSQVSTKGHDWLPGWINKYWDSSDERGEQRSPFKPGKGMVRRPDLVIVNDPSKAPTQDNIKQVVEIKFPPDKLSDPQENAYIKIAGTGDRFALLAPEDCNCDKPKPDSPNVPAPDPKSTSVGAMILMLGLGILAL